MSKNWNYYEELKLLAREKRSLYEVDLQPLDLNKIRNIYRQEGIKIKLSTGTLRNLKAAYFNDENGTDVLLNSKLPKEAKIFALIHELKHHYVDANNHDVFCLKDYDDEPEIEKGAEVFAAEFIWPEDVFLSEATDFGLKQKSCAPEHIVRFKRQISVPVSYTFIRKRLEWFKIIERGEFSNIKFRNLEYELFGVPYYLRRRRSTTNTNYNETI